jgi:hypothetical protein
MLKDLMVYLLGLKRPETIQINERVFKLNDYSPVSEPTVPKLATKTLSSITDFIQQNVDSESIEGVKIIHVESAYDVTLTTEAFGQELQRNTLISAENPVKQFTFGRFMDQEDFIIGLLSQFEMTENLKKVLAYASNIKREEGVEASDDGITQIVTSKTGVASLENVSLPNPIELQPRRTFTEIEQPVSMFVFRVSENKGFALFEADGGAWKIDATEKIRQYYEQELEVEIENGKVIVIA